MSLVWKLLRQHVSVPQFVGFFFANLLGMFIVLFGYQFYRDVLPVFTQKDSFMKADYVIVSKKIGMATTMSGRSNTFSNSEIDDLTSQPFVRSAGRFISTGYKVDATMSVNGVNILNSELFFESVPDRFVVVSGADWHYRDGDTTVPIILPRSYLTMYNFGFAQSHSLPKLSDGLVSMIDFNIFINGNGLHDRFKGRVIGFSNRISSILVPEAFMKWSNSRYAPDAPDEPTRLIMDVNNPADGQFSKYLDSKGYEAENNDANAEKMASFLRLMVFIVVVVGLTISALSFYILMLSIYLLVQKNSYKLENLLLIGYSPSSVSRPYQLLATGLNFCVLVLVVVLVLVARSCYMDVLTLLLPDFSEPSFLPTVLLGLLLFIFVTLVNTVVIRRKIINIWNRKE